MNKKNKILVCVDASYWLYYVIFGAQSYFATKYPQLASVWLKNPEEVDQSNLPDLINCQEFTKILRDFVMKRISTIDYLVKNMCAETIDIADGQDIVFALDDKLSNNFRKAEYSLYKANRREAKKQFDVEKIKRYILNVIFPDLEVVEKHGIKLIKVANAEGDDVIATLMMNFKNQYADVLLIASDHDFLQIDGIKQIDMMGREVRRNKPEEEELCASDFLLQKILMGDKSDNIPQVFSRCGAKTALKLVHDKEKLKSMLKEDQNAAKQFLENKKLISFNEIPKELTEVILNECNRALEDNDDSEIDLRDFMTL